MGGGVSDWGLQDENMKGCTLFSHLKGVVASADEGTPRLVPRLDPRKGRAGLLAGLGDAKIVPEPRAVGRAQEPRAVLVAGGIHVVDDAEAGGEEDREGGEHAGGFLVKAADGGTEGRREEGGRRNDLVSR